MSDRALPPIRRPPSERGQATVELALVLPMVFACLLAVIQVSVVVRDQIAVQHAAREAARAASVDRDPTGRPGRSARARARRGARWPSARRGSADRRRGHVSLAHRLPLGRRVDTGSRAPRAGCDAGGAMSVRLFVRADEASEEGSVAVLAIAIVVLVGVLALGVGRLGHAASDRARADTAADAAALAAAGALAMSRGAGAAVTSPGRPPRRTPLNWCAARARDRGGGRSPARSGDRASPGRGPLRVHCRALLARPAAVRRRSRAVEALTGAGTECGVGTVGRCTACTSCASSRSESWSRSAAPTTSRSGPTTRRRLHDPAQGVVPGCGPDQV